MPLWPPVPWPAAPPWPPLPWPAVPPWPPLPCPAVPPRPPLPWPAVPPRPPLPCPAPPPPRTHPPPLPPSRLGLRSRLNLPLVLQSRRSLRNRQIRRHLTHRQKMDYHQRLHPRPLPVRRGRP